MPTIADLFKDKENELYSNEKIRIESRGLVNPPRAAALVASSPNAIADLIGGQVAGVIGGSANRPSDTIFGSDKWTSKPVSITGVTEGLLQNAVKPNESYYVKHEPSGIPGFGPLPPIAKGLVQGGSSATGVVTNLAIQGINKIGSKKAVNSLAQQLKAGNAISYGSKYSIGADGKPLKEKITNSSHKEIRQQYGNEYWVDGLEKRDRNDNWDEANRIIQEATGYNTFADYLTATQPYVNANQVIVLFKKYGNNTVVPFVGAVTGISEDISPEWNGFKYIGSPFKVYRYGGVERSLKFNLKLYYFTEIEKSAMIRKINYLKSLTFPYESVSEITYGKSTGTSQYAFSPNLFEVSLGDMYQNVFGYMESLSFNVEDTTTWSNFAPNGAGVYGANASLYPSVIEASISIKIIENHKTQEGEGSWSGTKTYKYNFDGRGTDTQREFIEEVRKPLPENANYKPPMPPMAAGTGVRAYTPAPTLIDSLSKLVKPASVNPIRIPFKP
jgi:hypothetical protein